MDEEKYINDLYAAQRNNNITKYAKTALKCQIIC